VLDAGDEGLGDRLHEGGRGERIALVEPEERDDPERVHELGHVGVEVHSVDTLDLQGDMLLQDLGHTAC
jgi:hypothetical protein